MKRVLSIVLIAVFLLGTVGCSCGLSCCAKSNVPTPPENAAFTLAYDDASVQKLLAYFQANTGYQPTYIVVTEFDDVKTDPAARADVACIAVLSDEANAAALEEAGWTRISGENIFSLIVLEPPTSSTAVRNDNATSALKVWFGGTEAKYLVEHPDLWK